MIGLGTLLNTAGIVIGGVWGMAKRGPLSVHQQNALKLGLGAGIALSGLYLTWSSLEGPFLHAAKQLGIVLLALVAGRITGRLLHLQKISNSLGRFARDRLAASRADSPDRFSEGFRVCSILFCAAPLGILGAISDGLSGYFLPLAFKGLVDGLATLGLVPIFGWGAVLSAVPVLLFEGTVTLSCARFLQPGLEIHGWIAPVNATGGLLLFSVALIVLEVRKIQVADYLPGLCFAPLFAAWLS
jgi:uncharacterized protein